MSEPSIVIKLPKIFWKCNRSTSLKRPSRTDLSKSKQRKSRRYSSSFSSFSSSPASLSSHKRCRKSKKSKHSHKKRRHRSLSSSYTYPITDYSRYQRLRHPSPQAVSIYTIVQPDRVTGESQNLKCDNSVLNLQRTQDHFEQESWSFDKAMHEVFRFIPEEMCPRPSEDHTTSKPLSAMNCLCSLDLLHLQVLPQSKLVENTTVSPSYNDNICSQRSCH